MDNDTSYRKLDEDSAVIVGLGCIMPDAMNVSAFWNNVINGYNSIGEVPEDRWSPDLYYNMDPLAKDKTYSKLGAFVKDFKFDSLFFKIPPKTAESMDEVQKWVLMATKEALNDAGYFNRQFNKENTAVIIGNALGGELQFKSDFKCMIPEVIKYIETNKELNSLDKSVKQSIIKDINEGIDSDFLPITEDTMPGALSNVISGRVANAFNLNGANFTSDAACASTMAAITSAVDGLRSKRFDMVITGGADRNMGIGTYVKFCKIGALSPDGSRPFDRSANGFIMGEGAAVFIMKRLKDAIVDGDKIYAVLSGIGASSDGKGKGITAPNPKGQRLAIERAWKEANADISTVGYIEAHGTSTVVGDAVELEILHNFFEASGLPASSIAISSVKSQIGHLKSAAGAAGILKAVLSIHHKILPPSINFTEPAPVIDFKTSPIFINTNTIDWKCDSKNLRRAGISSFGFGGTNFHVVLEEFESDSNFKLQKISKKSTDLNNLNQDNSSNNEVISREILFSKFINSNSVFPIITLGSENIEQLMPKVNELFEKDAKYYDDKSSLNAFEKPQRICFAKSTMESDGTLLKTINKALTTKHKRTISLMTRKGVYYYSGISGKIAYMFPGQGSQYVNMIKQLKDRFEVVSKTIEEADSAMAHILDKPLSEYIYIKGTENELQKAEFNLKQTEITQPAILTVNIAIYRLLKQLGFVPDMVIGHSLGEYAALVAAGVLKFKDALVAVSARAKEMTSVSIDDPGKMASVAAPYSDVERVINEIDGYIVPANKNSLVQTVIAGESDAIDKAIKVLIERGIRTVHLPVSHAFHSKIVAPAVSPLKEVLSRFEINEPKIPVISNVTGDLYPMGPGVKSRIVQLLGEQVAAPVEFYKGIYKLYDLGCRTFIEVGPKRVLTALAIDLLEEDSLVVHSNHPSKDDSSSISNVLAALYCKYGVSRFNVSSGLISNSKYDNYTNADIKSADPQNEPDESNKSINNLETSIKTDESRKYNNDISYSSVSPLFNEFLNVYGNKLSNLFDKTFNQFLNEKNNHNYANEATAKEYATNISKTNPLVITGVSVGLPGNSKGVFDDNNIDLILKGESFISQVDKSDLEKQVNKNIVRLVKKNEDSPVFQKITNTDDVIKLAGIKGKFDFENDFGFKNDSLTQAMDITSKLSAAAGIKALEMAKIPLVQTYKETSSGKKLPQSFKLPKDLQDETGVIFASAFPGYDNLIAELKSYYKDESKREFIKYLESNLEKLAENKTDNQDLLIELIDNLNKNNTDDYEFNRKFLFNVLSMGHSQFAQLICAKGPNTQVNSACSSTSIALGIAEDWIHENRCKRVIVIAADDVTSDNMREWILSGFLASGAASTKDNVKEAALPFDKRRHGMIVGMGAAAFVVESKNTAGKRGVSGLAEIMNIKLANSAFHGSRLDVNHICEVMDNFILETEKKYNISREEIARKMFFMSHETYTPARGGSAAAEVLGLKKTFGVYSDNILISNTKGFTGHPMGAGIEDAIGLLALSKQVIPPVANFKEIDPELGKLNLSKGGNYPVDYMLRFSAGFGSQVALSIFKRLEDSENVDQLQLTKWLKKISSYKNPRLKVNKNILCLIDDPDINENNYIVDKSDSDIKNVRGEAKQSSNIIDQITDKILSLIVDKTGYPAEMLDADMDMEADLGIDTVKQAEMFAEIRKSYNIPAIDGLKLSDYPTIKHIVGFVEEHVKKSESKEQSYQDIIGHTKIEESTNNQNQIIEEQPSGFSNEIATKIIELIVDKTGYPAEMLDTNMDMEADLGIDTVKQAEMFAELRKIFSIPKIDNLKLSDYPTIGHLVDFISENTSEQLETDLDVSEAIDNISELGNGDIADTNNDDDIDVSNVKDDIKSTDDVKSVVDDDVKNDLGNEQAYIKKVQTETKIVKNIEDDSQKYKLNSVGLKRFVPQIYNEQISLTTKKTRITFMNGYNILVIGAGNLKESIQTKFTRAGAAIYFLDHSSEPSTETECNFEDSQSIIDRIDFIRNKAVTINGVLHLMPFNEDVYLIDSKKYIKKYSLLSSLMVKGIFVILKELEKDLSQNNSFIVAVTSMGGTVGESKVYDAPSPLQGAVTGLFKSLAFELPNAAVHVIDFEKKVKPNYMLNKVLQEIFYGDCRVEVGYKDENRNLIRLVKQNLNFKEKNRTGQIPDSSWIFLATGAAQGITYEVLKGIISKFNSKCVIFDIHGLPDKDMLKFVSSFDNEKDMKLEIANYLSKDNEKVTPVLINKEFNRIKSSLNLYQNLSTLRSFGNEVVYIQCDITDTGSVSKAINSIINEFSKIDVVIHGAGLEQSKTLAKKESEDFNKVLDVKIKGFINLHSALIDKPIKSWINFSSVAGRFGNLGQTDYSAANDYLNKAAFWLMNIENNYEKCISINWTGWQSVGMATRGSLLKIFEEQGVTLIPLEHGVKHVINELLYNDGETTPVIAGNLGPIDRQGLIVKDTLDRLVEIDSKIKSFQKDFPLINKVLSCVENTGLMISYKLNEETAIFLKDHSIRDVPYLPGVMGIEVFYETVKLLFPDYVILGFENLLFNKALKVFKQKSINFRVTLNVKDNQDDILVLFTKLESDFIGIDGKKLGEPRIHFTANILISKKDLTKRTSKFYLPKLNIKRELTKEEIYEILFHGPCFQVCHSFKFGAETGSIGVYNKPETKYFTHPSNYRFVYDPSEIEFGLQVSGIHHFLNNNKYSLPYSIEKLNYYYREANAKPFAAYAEFVNENESNITIVDSNGIKLLYIKGYQTVEVDEW